MTIVGVVGSVRQAGPANAPVPECYMPYRQHFYNAGTLSLVIRSAVDPSSLTDAVRRKARELSPAVPVRFTYLTDQLDRHLAAPRFRGLLVAAFAGIALVLALIGVFGSAAYAARQRTREIGLRMALGATPGMVLWLLLGRGLVMTAAGLALGLLGAAAASHLVSSLLFEVAAMDPLTYAAVAGLLGVTSLAALYLPAWRATRLSPTVALRHE
jgi:ABC-type antimicrobial peptide transport system permease subunit